MPYGTQREISFRNGLEKHPIIVIPIIQRDYGTGRTTEKAGNIRNRFSQTQWCGRLTSDTQLVLDFAYGSLKSHKTKTWSSILFPFWDDNSG